ncbi:YesL family protein [Blautia sp. MSJ-19]|uniref:YesL family protein n=1 Tax=Blautia sp. MSJ-19 TaxID=2841517 RepID=UPI001C0EBA68|nr:DUF624 domain-containing protein [Blautia sp. MSJ-19]MBU5480442.1 DUF624 domain-containing protein [Blautia sp. MSJ-19]
MGRFFNMDNKFFTFMNKVADLFILNIICVICCIPIVTAGASITAMYYVTLKMVRNEEAYIVRSFFKSFKENFKQATVINLILIAVGVILYLDLNVAKSMPGSAGQILHIIFMAFAIIYFVLFLYVYPILARFYNSTKNTLKNALFMAIRHLPYTVIMILIGLCPLLILFVQSYQLQSSLFVLFLFVGFGLIAYCNSFFLVKIFDNYMPKETEEESQSEGTAV